jgi:hypothetical protein
MALAFTGRYEFNYVTPTPGTDGSGNPITVQVPGSFSLGGISEEVARGIRFGLRRVSTITDVVVGRVMEDREIITVDPAS